MLDINIVKATIKELENQNTSFNTCEKLAALYTVLDHFEKPQVDTQVEVPKEVVKEYSDILPSYTSYCNVKRRFALHEVTDDAVKLAINHLCQEIKEFIKIIYINTDIDIERLELKEMLANIREAL